MQDTLVPVTRVAEITGLSRSEVYRRTALKTFPAKVRLSHKISRWSESECRAWVADQLAKRPAQQLAVGRIADRIAERDQGRAA